LKLIALDKYVFSAFLTVCILVIFSNTTANISTLSDIAVIAIALFNLYFVKWTYEQNRVKAINEIGNSLMPISFKCKLVFDMLCQYDSSTLVMDEGQEQEYENLISVIETKKHLFPSQIRAEMGDVLENSVLYLNYNKRMRASAASLAKVVEGPDDGKPIGSFLCDETQWIWENRSKESAKIDALAKAIEHYFVEMQSKI